MSASSPEEPTLECLSGNPTTTSSTCEDVCGAAGIVEDCVYEVYGGGRR